MHINAFNALMACVDSMQVERTSNDTRCDGCSTPVKVQDRQIHRLHLKGWLVYERSVMV